MDKDYIIIFLILILIIAILNKRSNNNYVQQLKTYYRDSKDKLEYNLKEINKKIEKENFRNNNVLPWVNESPHNITHFPGKVNTGIYFTTILSPAGSNKITISNINGIKKGDVISINPNGNNRESKTVAGIGNGLLLLDTALNYSHKPNEQIHNMSNENIKDSNIKNNNTKYYANIDKNDKLNYNEPNDPWGGEAYVGTMGAYQYTLSEADKVCKNKGLRLCAISEIIDKNICNAGWTSDRIRGYPMVTGIEWYDKKYANPNTRYQAGWCGGRSNGWRTWSTNPNNRGSAHCCKSNTTI